MAIASTKKRRNDTAASGSKHRTNDTGRESSRTDTPTRVFYKNHPPINFGLQVGHPCDRRITKKEGRNLSSSYPLFQMKLSNSSIFLLIEVSRPLTLDGDILSRPAMPTSDTPFLRISIMVRSSSVKLHSVRYRSSRGRQKSSLSVWRHSFLGAVYVMACLLSDTPAVVGSIN